MSDSSPPSTPGYDHTWNWEAAGSCPNCHYILPRLVDCAPVYFKTGHISCQECNQDVDLWQAAVSKASVEMPVSWALQWLGAAETSMVMPMETGRYYEIKLTEHGAPPSAKILHLHCTPQGGEAGLVTALEWHPNPTLGRFIGPVLRLIAVPMMEGPMPRTGRVLIKVIWIRSEESEAWPYLVTAFNAAANNEFAPSMVFSQSAVEVAMMPVIEQRLRRHIGAERVQNFMKDSLTYSHALNVILPYIVAELGAPRLPTTVAAELNKLRKKRNAIIHEGVKAADISRNDALTALCAAAFGFEYMRYIGPILLKGNGA